jgi:hypothetical protein
MEEHGMGMSDGASRALFDDARAVYDLEFCSSGQAPSFARIRADLAAAYLGEFEFPEDSVVAELEASWDQLVNTAFRDERAYDKLLARLKAECPNR